MDKKKCTCDLCKEYDKHKWDTIKDCKCFCHESDDVCGHESLCCEYPNGKKKDNPYIRAENEITLSTTDLPTPDVPDMNVGEIPAHVKAAIDGEYPYWEYRDQPIQQGKANARVDQIRKAMEKGYQMAMGGDDAFDSLMEDIGLEFSTHMKEMKAKYSVTFKNREK